MAISWPLVSSFQVVVSSMFFEKRGSDISKKSCKGLLWAVCTERTVLEVKIAETGL